MGRFVCRASFRYSPFDQFLSVCIAFVMLRQNLLLLRFFIRSDEGKDGFFALSGNCHLWRCCLVALLLCFTAPSKIHLSVSLFVLESYLCHVYPVYHVCVSVCVIFVCVCVCVGGWMCVCV